MRLDCFTSFAMTMNPRSHSEPLGEESWKMIAEIDTSAKASV